MPLKSYHRDFLITGILEKQPTFKEVKLNSGIVRQGVAFKVAQPYKSVRKNYYIVSYSKSVISILKDIKKQTFVQVEGQIASHSGTIYLLAKYIKSLQKGNLNLEVDNGNKDDSNKLVDGQRVPQD